MSKQSYGTADSNVPPYPGGDTIYQAGNPTSAPPYPPQGNPPYPPQGNPAYPPQGNPPYPGAPPYPGTGAPPYPQNAPQYPQDAPPYPQNAPQYHQSQGNPPYQGAPGPIDQGSYQGQVEPSCPPLEEMDRVPGYANVDFEGVSLPPPSYDEAVREPREREIFKGNITLTAEDAQESLLEHAKDKCCWGTGPARKMVINDLVSSSAYRLTLETFTESRRTKWASEPFYGGNVVVTGPPPAPWDIPATPPANFKASKLDVEVPNTASVKSCHRCRGMGYNNCTLCHGMGRRTCVVCSGRGYDERYENGEMRRHNCTCMGGMNRCDMCNGTGRRDCNKCKGRGNLRWFIQLTIKWTNHLGDHVEQRSALPSELVRDVTGQIILDETYPRVWPINNFPLQDLNTRSSELVSLHSTKFPMERILLQRQRIHCVPVTHVFYTLSSQTGSYFVYGLEQKIHAPDYPAQCCCGCSVL